MHRRATRQCSSTPVLPGPRCSQQGLQSADLDGLRHTLPAQDANGRLCSPRVPVLGFTSNERGGPVGPATRALDRDLRMTGPPHDKGPLRVGSASSRPSDAVAHPTSLPGRLLTPVDDRSNGRLLGCPGLDREPTRGSATIRPSAGLLSGRPPELALSCSGACSPIESPRHWRTAPNTGRDHRIRPSFLTL